MKSIFTRWWIFEECNYQGKFYWPLFIVDAGEVTVDHRMVGGQVEGSQVGGDSSAHHIHINDLIHNLYKDHYNLRWTNAKVFSKHDNEPIIDTHEQ